MSLESYFAFTIVYETCNRLKIYVVGANNLLFSQCKKQKLIMSINYCVLSSIDLTTQTYASYYLTA